MKHTRKLMALLLALVVVLSLSVTAFAAGTGVITVDNPVEGKVYKAYKIFDVVYDTTPEGGAGEHYAYTIDRNSKWFDTVNAYTGVKLTQVNGTSTYVVEEEASFSAAAFAETLKDNIDGKDAIEMNPVSGKPTASNLDLGYYLVSSDSGALCSLTTTNPSVTIYDKNVTPPLEKVDDKADVEVGETVNYTITGKVPSTTGYTTYTYKISDTMSAGLTFNNDVAVKIGGTTITSNYTLENRADGFDLTIDVMKYQDQVGADITVAYSATVNKNAIGEIVKNKATLTYSNDPKDGTATLETPGDEETVYSAKIVIDKHQTGSDTTKLAGAKFKLYKMDGTDKKYFKCDPDTKVVTWVTNAAQATEVTTSDSGAAEFGGLKNGTYYLEETAAPAGYNKLTNPVEVEINNGDTTTKEALTHTEHVANSTGTILPATGGMGTTIFYVVGSILLLGAAVLLITKKRMSAAK